MLHNFWALWVTGHRIFPIVVGALSIAMLSVGSANAQSEFWLTPSVSESGLWDDNIFSASDQDDDLANLPDDEVPGGRRRFERESDFISRTRAGVDLEWRGGAFNLVGGYSADLELYADHPDLNDFPARQSGHLSVDGSASPRLEWKASVVGTRTETPRDLNAADPLISNQPGTDSPLINTATALDRFRNRTDALLVTGSTRYALSPLTSASLRASFGDTDSAIGADSQTTAAEALFEHQWSSLTDLSIAYRFRDFRFDDDDQLLQDDLEDDDGEQSHVIMFGVSRQVTRQLTIDLSGGPRFSEGSVSPEVEAVVDYTLPPQWNLRFLYGRNQGTSAGEDEIVSIERFAGQIDYLFNPLTNISLHGGVTRNDRDSRESDVYTAGIGISRQVREWLILEGNYIFSREDGTVRLVGDMPGRRNEDILHNIVAISLTVHWPWRAL